MKRFETYAEAAAFEHRFWLQVLGDHARFIHDSLVASEQQLLDRSTHFRKAFDELLEQARRDNPDQAWQSISNEAMKKAEEIRAFKLTLINKHLKGEVKIHLTPSFLNHMVNEVEEYLRQLKYLSQQKIPPVHHPLHHHVVWLADAYGHSGAINDQMDHIEKRWKERSHEFTKTFENFYIKAVEMAGFLRANIKEFPALSTFNHDVELEMKVFQGFLQELEEMEMNTKVLSTFSALMADHMFREECYYLMKLAQSSGTESPECNPAKPRLEG